MPEFQSFIAFLAPQNHPGDRGYKCSKIFPLVQISNKTDQIISFHLGRTPPPYSSRSRCQTWTNPSIGSLIQNLPPVQSCELRSPKDWGEDVVQQHSLQLHRAVASCPLSSTNSNNFFLRVMMDPRKIGIKCARHFMTGAEHLLSIFYSGFQCKKAPSPKLHSFPFPRGEEGIRRILFQLPGVRPGLASHQQRSMNP